MKHGSLFSGIGGFDLAAQWMGWENVFQVEIDPFCQKVLQKNFPTVERYGDIKQFDGTKYKGTVDIITGGFPCQPYSVAGKRKGKEDSRHLWPEMLRVIREVQPKWILGENVGGLLSWNGGLVFEEVHADLEAQGYEVQSFVLPAAGVNAPHKRDRIWFVAYSNHDGGQKNTERGRRENCLHGQEHECIHLHENVTNSTDNGCERKDRSNNRDFENFPTQSPICRRDDGIPNRVDRIKGLGNAIVPQVAFEIFKAIESQP